MAMINVVLLSYVVAVCMKHRFAAEFFIYAEQCGILHIGYGIISHLLSLNCRVSSST